jgi:hypothetical protein
MQVKTKELLECIYYAFFVSKYLNTASEHRKFEECKARLRYLALKSAVKDEFASCASFHLRR